VSGAGPLPSRALAPGRSGAQRRRGPEAPVVFIGAGPGAADLITVRGAQRLAQADVVLHDALTDPALRALAPRARWVNVGKRGFCDSTGQARINALLVQHACSGASVVRLKGGDPSVFGRLEEELQALADADIDAEVVPGVTAAIAAAAATQRPLTRRGSGRSVALTTAMTRSGDLHGARSADTEVFYMAGRQLGALSRRLIDAGWPDQLHSDHCVETLAQATVIHAGRPTVVTVGAGAAALAGKEPTAAARIEGAAPASDAAAESTVEAAKAPKP